MEPTVSLRCTCKTYKNMLHIICHQRNANENNQTLLHIFCHCPVDESCPTLTHGVVDCSTPGSPVLHHLPLWFCLNSCPLSCWHYLTVSSSAAICSFLLRSFPASEYFPMSWLFTSGGQSNGASALAPVLPVKIQDWFPLGLTGLISLSSKGLLRVFSSTTVRMYLQHVY